MPANPAVQDPDHEYSDDEICDLLKKAEKMGFSLGNNSELESLTIRELDILVNREM